MRPVPKLARALAMIVPAGAMAAALIAQYGYGLAPCEMCWWQRYAHIAALVLAILAWVTRDVRAQTVLFWLAVLGIVISGLIGGFHAGVEYHWWQGLTTCSTTRLGGGDALDAIMSAPVIRCDVAAWSLFGISMAGYNCLGSLIAAAGIAGLARRGR
ncbi:disulfide bond formation protein B [Novosphingobium sp.]|uniref:disulfide bond formation protein B n=1 Tax=Novosphingobium sp. TaxID=1874826 RepID=UPI003D0E11EB